MHSSSIFVCLLGSATAAQALSLSNAKDSIVALFKKRQLVATCPAIFTTLSQDLTTSFLGSDGMCTEFARSAVRFAFHDAGAFSLSAPFVPPAGGGADGSLLLNPDEINRSESDGLDEYFDFIQDKFLNTYQAQGVGAADLIQYAAAHAIRTCPLGPKMTVKVGRKDSAATTQTGLIPHGFGNTSTQSHILALFQDKGFNAFDLAALIGAHTTAGNDAQPEIPIGNTFDTTPGTWDVLFYSETLHPPNNPTFSRLDSDINLSKPGTAVGVPFASFVNQQALWNAAFVSAMERMAVLGIPAADRAKLIDCTSTLPAGTTKRDIKAAPINARAR